MKRRNFIILTSLGAASASVLGACGHPEEKLIPALIPDDEYIPGIDYSKATVCGMCPAGCGVSVRIREHKANKIEGNSLHPVNQGALCARGQAGLQVLYNPDRIRYPLRRKGNRGQQPEFEKIGWDDAIGELASKLREIKAQNRAGSVVYAASDAKGVTGLAAESLMSGYGATSLLDGAMFNEQWTLAGYEAAYQTPRVPAFDIGHARYLLSFGSRFLETWHSPVMYSLAYGDFRRAPARGKFVQIEPRMSLTGASADEWLPAKVGAEGLIALGIAQVIVREGLMKSSPLPTRIPEFNSSNVGIDNKDTSSPETKLERYSPEATAEETGIPAQTIIRIAREFAASQPALAIGWGSTMVQPGTGTQASLQNMKAIHFLNDLVGNRDKPGGVLLEAGAAVDPFAKLRTARPGAWKPVTRKTLTGQISALLVHNLNLAYSSPWAAEMIKNIPLIVSFSPFLDETAQLADLILPDHSFLESWDLRSTSSLKGEPAIGLMQPVVKSEVDSRQTADVLIEVGKRLEIPLAFGSAEEVIRQAAAGLAKARAGSITADSPEDFWTAFSERGVWIAEGTPAGATVSGGTPRFDDHGPELDIGTRSKDVVAELNDLMSKPQGEGDFPLELLAYEHATLGLGEHAHLPWLQELPDPMTSVIWGSWVEINPKTAASLGIADGDLVEVQTSEGRVRAPAVLYPPIRPEVIAMPYGQGHEDFGRYAGKRGVNAALLNPLPASSTAGALAIRARVSRVSDEGQLIRFGTSLPERPETKR
jgi:anaerobic selenocysteine-containing dehydrogenase